MTQAQGMKAKGPNYHGNKVTSCSAVWPSSQEPGKMFQKIFIFYVGMGLGDRESAVLQASSKLQC